MWLSTENGPFIKMRNKRFKNPASDVYLTLYIYISVIAVTILIFLEDRRYRLVHGHKTCTRRKWCRLLFVIALYSLAAALPTPVFLHLPDQETGKLVSLSLRFFHKKPKNGLSLFFS